MPVRPRRWRTVVGLLIGVAAVGGGALPLPAALVEQAYAQALYPVIQQSLTPLSNLVSFAVLDVLILGVVVALIWRVTQVVGAPRGRRLRALGSALAQLLLAGAAIYLAFLLLWGLNYRRQPLKDRIDYRTDRITYEALVDLARTAVDEMNRLHGPAHKRDWPDFTHLRHRLEQPFYRAQTAIDAPFRIAPGRAKRSLLGLYFRTAGIDGMIDPFLLEAVINHDVLPFERPFVLAHEWAHLAGYADEGEANFIGWLACQEGGVTAQYSAWLFLGPHVWQELSAPDRRVVTSALQAGPRGDLAAIRERLERVRPEVSRYARRTYDRFLKANRVTEGIESYGTVVELVLGVRLDN